MNPAQQYNQALLPILALCRRKGFRAELMRQLSGLGMPVSKQTLCRWLTENRKTRVQPSFGAGLLLLQAATLAERELSRKKGLDIPGTSEKRVLEPSRP